MRKDGGMSDGTYARDMGDTLTLDKLNNALRQIESLPRLPELIVTTLMVDGKIVKTPDATFLSPNDARELHAKAPLILRQVLSRESGQYAFATPLDGPFPRDPMFPPFKLVQP